MIRGAAGVVKPREASGGVPEPGAGRRQGPASTGAIGCPGESCRQADQPSAAADERAAGRTKRSLAGLPTGRSGRWALQTSVRANGWAAGRLGGHLLAVPALLIRHVHIEPLAREVQTGVQHVLGLLVSGSVENPRSHHGA
jgi:hypothetical protein